MAKRVQHKPRRRVGLKEMGRRGLSMLMAMIMVISLIQISAFAAGSNHTSAEQIMKGYFTPDDTNKTVTDKTTDTAEKSTEGGNVTVSKTIAGTDKENEFLVTLEVQTKQKLSETVSSPDAAVTLVLDRSGSMNYCAECGNESLTKTHYYCNGTSGKEYYPGAFGYCFSCGKLQEKHNIVIERFEECKTKGCDSTQTRLDAAKAGAISFMDRLLVDTPKNSDNTYASHRYIAVVSFSSREDDAYASAPTIDCNWVDITTDAGYQTAVSAINGISANGGTYLQGGLKKAIELMNTTNALNGTVDITKLSNRYTVVLTDGKPTYSDWYGDGTECSENICDQTEQTANQLKSLSKIYSICYSADNEECYWSGWNWGNGHWVTVGDFLREISTKYYSADDIDELNTAFGNISDLIALLTEAWKVIDPMGAYINFGKVNSGQGPQLASCSDRTLVWDLKGDVPVKVTDSDTGKTYTYRLCYTITLDTLEDGYEADVDYATNGYTYLTYVFYNEDGQMVDENGNVLQQTPEEPFSISFNVPAVHGYADDLTFTKQAYHDKKLKLESSFDLAHSASCGCGLGTWNVTANSVKGTGTVTFKNIPSGHTYTLTETKAQGGYMEETKAYTVQVAWGNVTVTGTDDMFDGAVFKNKLDPQNKSFSITKTWVGGVSGSSISVDVYRQNGARDDVDERPAGDPKDTVDETVTLSGSGTTWTGNTKPLPTVDQETGDPITYYVKEQTVSGYEATYGTQSGGFTITNTKVTNGDITIQKKWNAPTSYYQGLEVKVNVYQDGELWKKDVILNEGNNWSETYEDVPTQVGGKEVTYRVEETAVGGVEVKNSTVTVNGHTYSVATNGTTVTNTLQDETVTFSGTKTWKDNNNAYGTRPETITIQVKNGDKVAGRAVIGKQQDDSYDWSYSITVPKFDDKYNEIDYDVVEVVNDSDYKSSETDRSETVKDFTNTLTDTMDINVEKIWDVPEGFFGTSEVEVTPEVEATVDAEGNEIPGTPATYKTVNNPAPDVTVQLYQNGAKVEGQTLTLSKDNDWEDSFTDLAKYDQNGVKYNYTVKETIGETDYDNGAISMAGKAMSVSITGDAENGFTVTNSAVGETSVTVNKIWVDGSNASDTRPGTIYVSLFADGALEYTISMTSANAAAGNDDQWTYTFENLAAYNGDEAIKYTVAETNAGGNVITTLPAAVESDSYNVSQNGYTITNTLAQRKDVSVSINKTWVDGDNEWDTRPDSVTFEVLENGEPICRTINLSANNNLTVSLDGLDRYDATGAPIEYTLKEQTNSDGKVEGKNGAIYTPGTVTSTDGYNFTATNTLDIPTIDLPVSKTWIDGNKNHGNDYVTAALVVNGVVDETRKVDLTPGCGWKGVFEDLPKYSNDYKTQYTYSVQELNVPEGYTVSYNGGQIINTIEDPVDVELTITKTWVGPEDQRPEYVTVGIFRASQGGEPEYVTGADVYLTAPTGEGANQSVWTATSESLDRYDAQGYPYTYSIREQDEGTNKWVGNGGTVTMGNLIYDVKINNFQITNTVQQSNDVTVYGTKTWSNVPENLVMPKSIQVILWADGGFVSIPGVENPVTVTPDAEGNWTYTFENLPRYAVGYGGDGHEIVYTVSEYGADVNGDIILGDHHFNVQGGTKNENGTYDLVNTYQSTDRYYYKVVGVYHTYHEDTGITDSVSVDLVAVTEGVKGETYTFDPNTESYLTYNGNAYEFDADNAGNTEPSATLDKANEIYTVYFHYTRTEKDDTDPGGGGGDGTTYYNLVVKYLEEGTDEELAPSYSARIAAGRSYDVTAQTEKFIDGYEFSQITGDDVTGYMNGNREIIVYYTVDIDDGETPLDPGPGGDGDGDGTDIDDGEVPLDPGPGGNGDGTDIGDENVPLVPATGDNLALWVMAAVASAAGLVYLTVTGKKREKDNA